MVSTREKNRLGCAGHEEQQRDLRYYAAFQQRLLPEYSDAARRKQSFHGATHLAAKN